VAESELHALVDGRLAPSAAQELRERLAAEPDAARTAEAWQQQREALRGLYAGMLEQPVPAPLLAAAERAAEAHETRMHWWRLGGMAASVLIVFALGWNANTEWHDWRGPQVARLEPAARHFAQQAAVAYAVYQPEVRHPVEVTAQQQDHLVQWLSKRLGKPLKVPVLTQQGYELVGGRLLPGDDGARAQFMYQNSAGQRVTLYLGALKSTAGPQATETAFRFLGDGPVPSFYWVDEGFGCALSGQLPRGALMELAEAVYHQLDDGHEGTVRRK
jgi:anti-sigma factor RsiW